MANLAAINLEFTVYDANEKLPLAHSSTNASWLLVNKQITTHYVTQNTEISFMKTLPTKSDQQADFS